MPKVFYNLLVSTTPFIITLAFMFSFKRTNISSTHVSVKSGEMGGPWQWKKKKKRIPCFFVDMKKRVSVGEMQLSLKPGPLTHLCCLAGDCYIKSNDFMGPPYFS